MTNNVRVGRRPFGRLNNGSIVEAIDLYAGKLAATVITFGATVQSLHVPDRTGRADDVVLGYASLDGYLHERKFMGATVGRYANRIAGARLNIGGVNHALAANEHGNTLHGGDVGFDQRVWDVSSTSSGATSASVELTLVSAHGDQGFPGTLIASALFTLHATNTLTITYGASTDRPTVVCITNHMYFNLAGEGGTVSALDHLLTINARHYTPVDRALIPTGELQSVASTPFDFLEPTPLGEHIRDHWHPQIAIGRGFDHNWVTDQAGRERVVARLEDPTSGRILEIISNQPGLQLYSGNLLDGTTVGKSGRSYRQGDAIVLEPQLIPDTPSRSAFGLAQLLPDQQYRNRIVYGFC